MSKGKKKERKNTSAEFIQPGKTDHYTPKPLWSSLRERAKLKDMRKSQPNNTQCKTETQSQDYRIL